MKDKRMLINELVEAEEELEKVREKLNNLLKDAPEAEITTKKIKGRQYFYEMTPMVPSGRYIRKDNTDLIRALAQKKYNKKLIDTVSEELGQIRECLSTLKERETDVQGVLKTIPESLHPYIDTDILMDKEYVRKWKQDAEKNGNLNPKETTHTFDTTNGEKVKSKSEWIIAETLRKYGVPYSYEKPFDEYFMGMRTKYNVFPDFTCLNRRTGKTYYWEHFGMMDDPLYVMKFIARIQSYAANNIFLGSELIISMEANKSPLGIGYIHSLIEKYLI